MKKFKLAILMNSMPIGGTEKALINFLNYIDFNLFDITLLLLDKKGELLKDIPKYVKIKELYGASFAIESLSKSPIYNILYSIKSFQFNDALKMIYIYTLIKITNQWYKMLEYATSKIANEDSYDICISYPGPLPIISYICLNKINASKKLQFIHSDVRKTFNDLGFGSIFYHKFDKIICVSNDSAKHFKEKYPKCENVEVFNNIINKKEILTLSNKASSFDGNFLGFKILTVARLSEEKGVKLIPEIIQHLISSDIKDFKWYIIGEGPEREYLNQIINRNKINKFLILLGSKLNPYPYIKDCDIYIQPSLYEGFGISVVEAKIFNKPMVISNFSNAKNLITNDITGLISPIDSIEISKKIITLIKNKNLYKNLQENLKIENNNTINVKHTEQITNLLLN